jgi:3-oxoacyl-[acyl-carrier protein] reductase
MNILVFGGTGSLGKETTEYLRKMGHNVIVPLRTKTQNLDSNNLDLQNELKDVEYKLDGVAWFQGANINDNVQSSELFTEIFEANTYFIVRSMKTLFDLEIMSATSRLLIISSVWQNLGKRNKFSYSVSKSAISGIVKSVTADYGSKGISINAILPGVVNNKMTEANLTSEQIGKIQSETPSGALVTSQEIASIANWLLSPESSGIAGQCITVDNGWSDTRDI